MPLAIDSIISCPFLKYVYKFALVQKQASAGFQIVLPSESFLVQHLLKAFFHKLAFPFIMLPCYSLSGMPQQYKTTIRLVLV